MKPLRITASAIVNASPTLVYSFIADYRNGHPRILPKPYFDSLKVERGGVGTGTVITFEMRLLGKTRAFRGTVTEPEPGKVLAETYEKDGTVTTFTVEPVDEGHRTQVTITTDLRSGGGVLGPLGRVLIGFLLRRIYHKELALLGTLVEDAHTSRFRKHRT